MSADQPENEEHSWTSNSSDPKNSESGSTMAHENQRANSWQIQLDETTNWAVVVTLVSIAITFSQPNTHHGVLILTALLITLFLIMEAVRYRNYEWWSYQIRLMEPDFFVAMLAPAFHSLSNQWAERLADNILHFNNPISIWEAIGLRLRRKYLLLFSIIVAAWLAKYGLFPAPPASLGDFIGRAKIDPVQGPLIMAVSLVYFVFLMLLSLFTLSITRKSSEVLPRHDIDHKSSWLTKVRSTFRRSGERNNEFASWQPGQQFLALIITSKVQAVVKDIVSEVGCEVTAVAGEGSTLLICTLAASEIQNLKDVVANADLTATVNVLSAQEVLEIGRDYDPLSDE
jgi:uncharacterized membrane protein